MITRYKMSKPALFAILMLSLCALSVYPVGAENDQPTSKLQVANIAVDQAFNVVLNAEKAGANVTDLLAQLNVAEGNLAQAENSYRTGDTNNTANQADSVLLIAQQVMAAAQSAKQTAIVSSQNTFWLTIAFTVIGIIMFLEILFLAWAWFKRNYIKNLSEAKPEVTVNET